MEAPGSTNRIARLTRLRSLHASIGALQRELLEVVSECDRAEDFSAEGCWGTAQLVSAQLGNKNWETRRWVTAARALPKLPLVSQALASGGLCLDKVLDLSRFATPETEAELIAWAQRVTPATVKHRADVACAPTQEEAVQIDRSRYVRYSWGGDGRVLWLEGCLPAAQGAVFAKALDRMAGRLPDIIGSPDEEPAGSHEGSLEMRRADALVALASHHIASDADADRATMVVHAPLAALAGDSGGWEIEGGGVLNPETARRLACDCRLEVVLHGKDGDPLGIGRMSRTPPPWLMRQLRHRDRGCTFPGCGARWFLHAHHIRHWGKCGETVLGNLTLACTFHHKLVHEYGWNVELAPPGTARWFRPDGTLLDPLELFDRAPPRLEPVAV